MRKQDRRAAIINEAIHIIGEQGYHGFSLNDLARRCEISTAGLLHHFGSKDGLLIALLDERDRRDRIAIAKSLNLRRGQILTRHETLMVLRAIIGQNTKSPHLVKLYATLRVEALMDGHPAQQYFAERESETRSIIAQLVAHHTSNPDAAAREITGMIHGIEVQWLREGCSFDLVAACGAAADKLLA